jgi:nucleoside 2-deoxyribosyltransferase
MKSVVICGSRRFKSEIREFAKVLKEKGVFVFEPILHEPDEEDNRLSEHTSYLKFLGLTHHQFSEIRKGDVCFVYNKNGYSGVSTTLEIGFAAALNKPIYALSNDEEPCRRVLFDEIIETPEKLIEKLK